MRFIFRIAWRYFYTKSKHNAVNIISIISVLGLLCSVVVLTIVLSGFSGFKNFTLHHMGTTDPDIRILSKKGKTFLFDKNTAEKIKNTAGISGYTKTLSERAFLRYNNREAISHIKGVDSVYTITGIENLMYSGSWLISKKSAVVSSDIGYKLEISTGYATALNIYVPRIGKLLPLQNPFNRVSVQPVGFFREDGMQTENGTVYIPLKITQKLLQKKSNEISTVDIKTKAGTDLYKLSKNLQEKLGKNFIVKTKIQLHNTFYKIINTERLVAYLVATLAIIITLFNVIGAMIMIIIEKKDNLFTLVKMGVSVKQLKKIFQLQGLFFCFTGLFLGLVIATILIALQQHFGWFKITPNTPYPVLWEWNNFFIILGTMTVLPSIAVWIASKHIDKVFSNI